ncbi:DNA gyrase inhibitor YacG [Geminicoccus roseus]|uniref:DNA gyrase inhibitor YacG n=1 Tax=Geminicoccus roseus TaxID=404900 RepID=UPI0004047B7F|nr:DNA gyrase inhibitor YacG [Geminicoccus roseus]
MTTEPATGPRCPICGKPRVQEFRPFCSRGCRDRDFLAWADGRYAIPAVEVDDDPENAEQNRAQPPRDE